MKMNDDDDVQLDVCAIMKIENYEWRGMVFWMVFLHDQGKAIDSDIFCDTIDEWNILFCVTIDD